MLLNVPKLRKLMKMEGLSVLMAFSPEDVFYASGFYPLEPYKELCTAIISREGKTVLLVPKYEEGSIPVDCWAGDQRFYGKYYVERSIDIEVESEDPIKVISSILHEMGVEKGVIGIDIECTTPLTVDLYEKLRKELPKAEFKGAYTIFRELRIIKSNEEIRRIKKAVKALEEALLRTYENVREGITELELVREFKVELIRKGAECLFAEMGAGVRSGFPTFYQTEYKIKKGDVIHFDVGATVEGYCSDMARNAVLGKPSVKQKRVHEAQLVAQQKVFEAIRPGVMALELFNIAQEAVRKAGYPEYRRHQMGHGIGLGLHEDPHISPTNDRALEPGMVLCIEVPYYIANFGGFNLEDVVLVTEDGYESISTIDRGLYVL